MEERVFNCQQRCDERMAAIGDRVGTLEKDSKDMGNAVAGFIAVDKRTLWAIGIVIAALNLLTGIAAKLL
jgi:hypothetical protein